MDIEKLEPLYLGQHTETGVYSVRINMGAWMLAFPDITSYEIFVTSPDGEIYPVISYLDGNTLVWEITRENTAVAGKGKYQVLGISLTGTATKASEAQNYEVFENMPGLTEDIEPPVYAQSWAEQVAFDAQTATNKAHEASVWSMRAEQAAATKGYIFFDIDERGHVIVTKTKNVEELDFRLNEGRLEVVYG